LGLIDLHNESDLSDRQPELERGGRVIERASLGEKQQIGDRFGAAIAIDNIDDDNCFDVVVGAPGVDGGGAVYVIYGTRAGLGTGPSMRIPIPATPGDAFGDAVAVESLVSQPTQQRLARIWIGAPGRDVAGLANAGAVAYVEVVNRVAGTPRLYTQNSPGVPGQAEPGDRFGDELAVLRSNQFGGGGGVLVGQPSEDVGVRKDAGMVTVLPAPGASPAGPGPYGVTEDTPGVPGAVEADDRFGAAVDAFGSRAVGWVGVPNEDLGAVRDAGMVHGLRIGATKVTSITYLRQGQDRGATIPGRPEAGDHFGASVRGGHEGDSECTEAQVVIGVPGEDVGTIKDAGEADSYFGRDRNDKCLPGVGFNLGANARPGDRLGAAVGRKRAFYLENSEELLVGIPGYDIATAIDAGVVLKGLAPRVTQPPLVYTQSDGALPSSRYGTVLNR
jgi:hypothetical protein